MPKILITGATGFTGSHLTKRLLDEGQEVRILVRPTSNFSQLERAEVETAIGDITDEESVRKAVKGIETVYHIAAVFRKAGLPDEAYWATNFQGTQNLLKASMDFGICRFIHCSTVGVHSHVENPPSDETAPYEPGDVYQRSKCEAEQAVLRAHKEHGLQTTVIRPTGIYGPGDTRWLKLFKAIARRRFVMLGSGETYIHMVYISDLIDAFRLAADNANSAGKVYIIGGERYVTLNELAETIAKAVGAPVPRLHFPVKSIRALSGICEDVCRYFHIEPPIFRRRVDFFVKNRAFDITKAKTELGYSPKIGLDDGIRLTASWYKENNLL